MNTSFNTVLIGDKAIPRMGFGTMRLTGPKGWGPPADRATANRLLRRAVELERVMHFWRRFSAFDLTPTGGRPTGFEAHPAAAAPEGRCLAIDNGFATREEH